MKSQLHRDMEALTPNERGFLDVTPEEAREATARVVEAAGRMCEALEMIRDAARDAAADDVAREWVLETAKRADAVLEVARG